MRKPSPVLLLTWVVLALTALTVGLGAARVSAAPAARPNVGDCIAQSTGKVKYVTCAPICTTPDHCQWVTALTPFNQNAPCEPFINCSASDYRARYGHDDSLQTANALGHPASMAACGTPVGERYNDSAFYEKRATVCPMLPANYVITAQDEADMKMAAYGASTWWDVLIVPPSPVTPHPDFCNNPQASCHPPCEACPVPPPCPTCPSLAAVPQDVRDTINAAPSWFPAGSGKRAALNRVKAWLALVDSYKPKVPSTGASVVK